MTRHVVIRVRAPRERGPVRFVHVHRRVRERRRAADHGAASVVGVQVRDHHVTDVCGLHLLPRILHGLLPRRVRREVADPRVDQDRDAGGQPNDERVHVPPPPVGPDERPWAALALAIPVDGSARGFIGERERRPPLADRPDLDAAHTDRLNVRHRAGA